MELLDLGFDIRKTRFYQDIAEEKEALGVAKGEALGIAKGIENFYPIVLAVWMLNFLYGFNV